MIKSMTGYGRASGECSLGRVVFEVHAVNRKTLDIALYLPKDFLRFDYEIRKQIAQRVERGQVTVRMNIHLEGLSGFAQELLCLQLKNSKARWEEVAVALGYDPHLAIDLPFLLSQSAFNPIAELGGEEEKELNVLFHRLIAHALDSLLQMRKEEGINLVSDIEIRLQGIEAALLCIEARKEEPLVAYRKKMQDRLHAFFDSSCELEEKMMRELAILAEKMDVTEEIVRMRAHIQQFRRYLALEEGAVGRTLDFLTQEMHREINTLGSKSIDSEISSSAIIVKGEIEKIREQVQNIE